MGHVPLQLAESLGVPGADANLLVGGAISQGGLSG